MVPTHETSAQHRPQRPSVLCRSAERRPLADSPRPILEIADIGMSDPSRAVRDTTQHCDQRHRAYARPSPSTPGRALHESEHLPRNQGCPACISLAAAGRTFFSWFANENHTSADVQAQLRAGMGMSPVHLPPDCRGSRRGPDHDDRHPRGARRCAPTAARREPWRVLCHVPLSSAVPSTSSMW